MIVLFLGVAESFRLIGAFQSKSRSIQGLAEQAIFRMKLENWASNGNSIEMTSVDNLDEIDQLTKVSGDTTTASFTFLGLGKQFELSQICRAVLNYDPTSKTFSVKLTGPSAETGEEITLNTRIADDVSDFSIQYYGRPEIGAPPAWRSNWETEFDAPKIIKIEWETEARGPEPPLLLRINYDRELNITHME
jgi:hypothetical protein